MHFPARKMFITGTNTDIGKTVVSAILMAGLRGCYWKPIQTGTLEANDTEWVRQKTGLGDDHFLPETYCFREPLSPHAAAALESRKISLEKFELPVVPDSKTLIVEGAGGIMVPLNDDHFMLDLIKKLAIPIIIVAESGLGTINHTLLTVEQLRKHDLEVLGVVMNGPRNNGNRQAIEKYGQVNVLAEVEPLPEISPQSLSDCYHRCFPVTDGAPSNLSTG